MLVDPYFDKIASPIVEDALFISMKKYVAHRGVSVYDHCVSVAEYAYQYARNKGYCLDYSALIRGALLHDFYLYDWHHSGEGHKLHGFRHPFFALVNASKRFELSSRERNIIASHMFPVVFWVVPSSKEARLVIKADRHCAWMETFPRHSRLQKGNI
jgi:uncharacterized protein